VKGCTQRPNGSKMWAYSGNRGTSHTHTRDLFYHTSVLDCLRLKLDDTVLLSAQMHGGWYCIFNFRLEKPEIFKSNICVDSA